MAPLDREGKWRYAALLPVLLPPAVFNLWASPASSCFLPYPWFAWDSLAACLPCFQALTWYDAEGRCWCDAADGWRFWWDAAQQQWQQHSQVDSVPSPLGQAVAEAAASCQEAAAVQEAATGAALCTQLSAIAEEPALAEPAAPGQPALAAAGEHAAAAAAAAVLQPALVQHDEQQQQQQAAWHSSAATAARADAPPEQTQAPEAAAFDWADSFGMGMPDSSQQQWEEQQAMPTADWQQQAAGQPAPQPQAAWEPEATHAAQPGAAPAESAPALGSAPTSAAPFAAGPAAAAADAAVWEQPSWQQQQQQQLFQQEQEAPGLWQPAASPEPEVPPQQWQGAEVEQPWLPSASPELHGAALPSPQQAWQPPGARLTPGAAGSANAAAPPAAQQQQPAAFQPFVHPAAPQPQAFVPLQPAAGTAFDAQPAAIPAAYSQPAVYGSAGTAAPPNGSFAAFVPSQAAMPPAVYAAAGSTGSYSPHGRPPAAFSRLLFGGRLLVATPTGKKHVISCAPALSSAELASWHASDWMSESPTFPTLPALCRPAAAAHCGPRTGRGAAASARRSAHHQPQRQPAA